MERDRVIDDLQRLDVDLSLPAPHIRLLSHVFNHQDLYQPRTEAQIAASQQWIRSREKVAMEHMLISSARVMFGSYVRRLAGQIASVEGGDGYYFQLRGFLGYEDHEFVAHKKIQTMQKGADRHFNGSVFEQPGFTKRPQSRMPPVDRRILPYPWVAFLRRSGLDELPQIFQQAWGKHRPMDLIGLRAYNKEELQGLKLLIDVRDDVDLGISLRGRKILETYEEKITRYHPRPAIPGPHSATVGKDSPVLFRMMGDIAYCERASPYIDFRLFVLSFVPRLFNIGAR